MRDQWGNKLVYWLQPVKLDYEISHSDPVTRIMEGRFKTYRATTLEGTQTGPRQQMNRKQAEQFAKFNGLQFITEDELYPQGV